jgi:hypothetical protein
MSLKMFLEPRELKLLCRILMIPRNISSVTRVARDMCNIRYFVCYLRSYTGICLLIMS